MSYFLGQILNEYEAIVDAVIRGELTEDDGFKELLKDLEHQILEKVDNWIAKIQSIENYVYHCNQRQTEWETRKKASEGLLARLKNHIVCAMKNSSFPILKGKEGSLKLVNNSQPRLIIKLPTKKIYLPHAMPVLNQDITHNYPEFFQETSFYTLDTDAIKKALVAGRQLEFADIEYGQHVRIL